MTDELPTGWVEATIGELFDTETGSTPPKNDEGNYGDFIPLVKPPELQGGAIHSAADGLSESGAAKARVLPSESVLVSCIGNLGKAALNLVPVAFNQQINAILPRKAVADPWFILYQVRSATFTRRLEALSSATTIAIVNKSKFNSLPVRIAPRQEQSRIVSKIDELFSRIDEGERALERVQQLVERYRQSVLKAAVTGELTRDWRDTNKDKLGKSIETGEALLARILKARREAWEKAELDKMKAKGITPANDKWKQRYEEPAAPDVTQLPALPHGWVWGSINQLCALENGDRGPNYPSRAHYVDAGVPFITAGNIQDWKIDPEGLNFITEERFALLRAGLIEPGDLLFCLRGSLGKAALNTLARGAIASSLVIARPALPVLAKYLLLYFQSPLASHEIEKYDNGTAQPNLAAADLGRFAVPIPPTIELSLILDQAERVVEAASRQVSLLVEIGDRAQALRQATLKMAFAGALTPQDPSDEPASVLLERITAERSEAPTKPKRGRKPKTSEPA